MTTIQKPTAITLTLTETAAAEVQKFMAEEKVSAETAGLRIAVLPGGCSGFKYSLNIEERPLEDDLVLESAGVRVFVDGFSAQYLNGVRLDYKSNFQESGFAFENPNASGGCGCGSSVSVWAPLAISPAAGGAPRRRRPFFFPPRPPPPAPRAPHLPGPPAPPPLFPR